MSKGLVKAIGISNFTITKTENLLKTAKIVPAVNQVECHPFFQQEKLKHYCDKRGKLPHIPNMHAHNVLLWTQKFPDLDINFRHKLSC